MRKVFLFLLVICCAATRSTGGDWGQADSEDKLDPYPWMWELRGIRFKTPEASALAMVQRSGVWGGIYSQFVVGKWMPLEDIKSKVLWKTQKLAIIQGRASSFRSQMCAVWLLLRFNDLNSDWFGCDALIRRDIGHSDVETGFFEKVKDVAGPLLFIDTYRGGRRCGDQSYELYRIENALDPSNPNRGDNRNPAAFRRCLMVNTRYRQRDWRGEAKFSITKNFDIKVEMLRENMPLEKQNRSEILLNWDRESRQFDAEPIEQFIGLQALAAEDQKTSNAR
ncbi:MAG: hypothetical protein PHV34_19655 [Verrucomicrobiae bacterium]|nr:hypothetical protein [Verrucomicrobiae bacterium]